MNLNNYSFPYDDTCDIAYEDESCKIGIFVTDFRDPAWWIGINFIVDKRENCKIKKLSEKQMEVLCQRISRRWKTEILDEKIGLVQVDALEKLETDGKNLLEIE